MEIKVGEYIRTNRGKIGKLIRIERDDIDTSLKWYVFYDGKDERYVNKPYIEKASKNIIDLIECGDYVNGCKVVSILNGFAEGTMEIKLLNGDIIYRHHLEDIKSILTKEQFSSLEYII